ncbi:hypothetical protein V8C35DRAFT_212156 [Trichoderma chlorosporum]
MRILCNGSSPLLYFPSHLLSPHQAIQFASPQPPKMYGIRAIILSVAAAAALVQGAEQGHNTLDTVVISVDPPSATPTVDSTALVTSAPTAIPELEGLDWAAFIDDSDDKRVGENSVPRTQFLDPFLGPFISVVISRLRELEHQLTARPDPNRPFPNRPVPTRPVPTRPPLWDITVPASESTIWVSLPTMPVTFKPEVDAEPTDVPFLNKAVRGRIVSTTASNATNQTATSTSRPTKVPPPVSGGVAHAVAPMGAVVVFVAGCLLLL